MQNYPHVRLLNFSKAIFLVFMPQSLYICSLCSANVVTFMSSCTLEFLAVVLVWPWHKWKQKFQVKYSYVTRVCVPKPNLLLGIVHFLHTLDIKEYFTPKMDLCIDWKQILNEYVICILICTYELRNIYIRLRILNNF